jgi:hypothetical protein
MPARARAAYTNSAFVFVQKKAFVPALPFLPENV